VKLRAPFLKLALKPNRMELEVEDVFIYAELKRGFLYAEIYVGDYAYFHANGEWEKYDEEGQRVKFEESDRLVFAKLAKKLSQLPKYEVLEKLLKAITRMQHLDK